MVKEEKQKALDAALAQIEKQFGKGSVMKLGDKGANMQIETIPTGCLSLDLALGLGGIEAYYPTHSKIFATQTALFCEKKGLLITSGSDDHGLFAHTDGWQQYHIGCQMMEPHRLRLGNLAPEE